MKRLLFIGFAACTLALAPGLASAMPVATPGALALLMERLSRSRAAMVMAAAMAGATTASFSGTKKEIAPEYGKYT